MPLLANKVYVLNKTKKDKKEEEGVLSHPLTNEICENAEELERKVFLYGQKIWTCKITGQINLTFKEAQKSEQGCAKMLKNSFMKCYEPIVLQYVHHSRENLDNIIHKAWTQIHEEYCVNEPVMIKLTTPKQLLLKGVVVKVDRTQQKQDGDVEVSPSKITSDASSSDKENTKKKTIPIKKSYHYSVKLFEMDKLVNDIPAETIERTLRPPSKDQIRMFIRAHAVRYSGKPVNPWVVDDDLVKKYKLTNTEPDFICDKLKMKEVSRSAEIHMYAKLMEDVEKMNDETSTELLNGTEKGHKKPARNSGEGSKKLKQMTLLDMRKTPSTTEASKPKIKSPFSSPGRSIPPLAQQLLKLMKDNKADHNVNQLMLKCCQYTDGQIAKFPDLIRIPIKEKKERLELKKKLKAMSQSEREAYMAERRHEQRQLQREKKKLVEEKQKDDADMEHTSVLVEGDLVPSMSDCQMSHDQWARVVSLAEFIRSFKGVLGPVHDVSNGDVDLHDLCRAMTNDHKLLAELVCLFLRPLLQDSDIRQRREMGVTLGEIPVTVCTAGELLKLVLMMDENIRGGGEFVENGEIVETCNEQVDHRSQINETDLWLYNNKIASPICERLASGEIGDLSIEEKISALELLQGRILDLDIISTYIDECQRDASEAYKKRIVDVKELNDRLKEVRVSISETNKVMTLATAAMNQEAAAAAAVVSEDQDIPQSARRRLSLEIRSKEAEEREKVVELERQLVRLDKEEASIKRQIDASNHACASAFSEAKMLMRVQSLGSDRYYRRYWHFKSASNAIYVERDGASVSEWRMYANIEAVESLINSLDERGLRENALKKELEAIMPSIRAAMINGEPVDTSESQTPRDGSFITSGFKEELRETELNIRQGSLGGVEDYSEWERTLMASDGESLDEMKQALVSVFLGVHERFWNVPMKSSIARSEYLAAINESQTATRLCLLQSLLDVCVCWSKSASDDKCRVCHKSNKEDTMLLCDGCNVPYHIFCLRPPLRRVPDGEWLCPRCNPSTRSTNKDDLVTAGEYRDEEEDMEDVCCVCKGREPGMGRCVSCQLCYHPECHEPPMRHMRHVRWYCAKCRLPNMEDATQKNTGGEHDGEKERDEDYRRTRAKRRLQDSDSGGEDPRKKKSKRVIREEEESEEEEVTRPTKKSKRCTKNDEDENEDVIEPSKNSRRHAKEDEEEVTKQVKSSRRVIKDNDDEEENEEITKPTKKSRRYTKEDEDEETEPVKKNRKYTLYNEEEDDEEEEVIKPSKKTRRAKKEEEQQEGEKLKKTREKVIKGLLRQMNNHKSAWPFRDAVDEDEVPDYYQIVSDPMDLASMMSKCNQGKYGGGDSALETFLDDVALMFNNAELYNDPDSEIMRLANELEQYFVTIYSKCDLPLEYTRSRDC